MINSSSSTQPSVDFPTLLDLTFLVVRDGSWRTAICSVQIFVLDCVGEVGPSGVGGLRGVEGSLENSYYIIRMYILYNVYILIDIV